MGNLGVIGSPSDWLIASDVSYSKAKELFDINLIDIDIKELISLSINRCEICDIDNFNKLFNNQEEINKAYRIYLSLKDIVNKYDLKALTVRCFDLLDTVHSTACLAFSMLNSEGITSTCEGDVPSLIGMYLVKKLLNKETFQANPSRIYTDLNKIVFAHCTLPLSMTSSYIFNTHYESNTGIGIKGEMFEKDVSIFRISSSLDKYVLLEGKIEKNLSEERLCRTQIEIKLDETSKVDYFLFCLLVIHIYQVMKIF